MSHYDLILLGESSFTLDIKKEFDGKVKLLLLPNNIFSKEFSTALFPNTTFIPQRKEDEGVFGQLISDSFRFDLTTNREITKLLWTEEVKEVSETLDLIENNAAFELNIANLLFIEHYGEPFMSVLIKDFRLLLKNIKPLKLLFLHSFPNVKRDFINFLSAMRCFFSPGEQNTKLYNKYLLYSLLSKKVYSVEDDFETPTQKDDYGLLKGLTYGTNWELRFENQKVTGKILVSALPPHLFTLSDITHPFKTDYDEAFYLFTPKEPIDPPCGMGKELVYINDNFYCFIKNDHDIGLQFYLPYKLGEPVKPDLPKPVIDALFPHVKTLPSFNVKPHLYPNYTKSSKKTLTDQKNLFFLKNFEYPYLGIDGELIYRKRLKEILWKKLL